MTLFFYKGIEKIMDKNISENYLNEERYLNNVMLHLNDKINDYINKRKEISDVIVEYRRKFIEEYRDDDDKVFEYFDHENYKNEQIFNTIEKRIKELLYLKKNPYFGKIKIFEDGCEEKFYIGAYGFDVGGDTPLIIDWRAPIASIFYQGKLGDLSYKLLNGEEIFVKLIERIQILIKNGKIVSFFDSEIDVKDEFLKEMLSLNTSSKLKNIIQTIQSNQDKIIREEKNKTIIINGVAGSGKTSVALHRVSYLLYNFREYFEDGVLILGPNKIFMDYISNVIPSLGEYGGIYNYTSEDFIYLSLNEDLNFNSYDTHMEKILNDKNYLEEFKLKGEPIIKNEIDKFLNYVEENINIGYDIFFRDKIVITGDEVKKLFYDSFKSRVLEIRIELIRRRIIDRINKIRNIIVREISNKYKNMKIEEDMVNHYDMIRKNEIYDVISEAMIIKDSIKSLKLKSPYELYKEFYEEYFSKNLENLDFGDLILIKYIELKVCNVKRERDFKLVVIDEAQDFSYMFYEVIKEFTRARSYVIVGDLNQSIICFDRNFIESTNIFDNKKYIIMEDSYRSTKNIMDYALKYLNKNILVNSIREGEKVSVIECDYEDLRDNILNIINSFKESEYLNIGIIVKDRSMLNKIYELIRDVCYIKLIYNEDHVYSDNGIFLTTIYFSKGLEFDHVIVIDNNLSENILYIMLTRAMHSVFHIKN